MEKLLITGACGLIGRACCQMMQGHYELYGISRFDKSMDGVTFLKCNLLNANDIYSVMREIQPNKLLHLAWETETGKYLDSVKNLQWPIATYNLMSAFYECGGSHAVIAGTCFEYDISCGILEEYKTPLIPTSIYGLSKKYTYDLLSLSFKEMPFAWGRIFYVYGRGEDENRLVPFVVQKLQRGEKAICSSGEQIRDYLHVEDIASAFFNLIKSYAVGPYNICSGKTTKIKDIVNEIGTKLDKRHLLVFDPALDRPSESPVILGKNHKLRSLGWESVISIESGVANILE